MIKTIAEQLLGTLDVKRIDTNVYILNGKYYLHIIKNNSEIIGIKLIKEKEKENERSK